MDVFNTFKKKHSKPTLHGGLNDKNKNAYKRQYNNNTVHAARHFSDKLFNDELFYCSKWRQFYTVTRDAQPINAMQESQGRMPKTLHKDL